MSGGREHWDEGAPWNRRAPRWFWAVAGACLAWNVLVAGQFLLSGVRVHGALPPPVAGSVALAVAGALAGSALMLARLRHAAMAYVLSFAGAAGALAWHYTHGAPGLERGVVPYALAMPGVALLQLWLSRRLFWLGLLR